MKPIKNVLPFAVALAFIIIAFSLFTFQQQGKASITMGSEYMSTTTYALAVSERILKTSFGSLGSVVITGDNTGLITLYNATTSDVTKRTGNKATSTITIADFPASSPEGTYTFDVEFTDGLLLVTSGSEATSTITYR